METLVLILVIVIVCLVFEGSRRVVVGFIRENKEKRRALYWDEAVQMSHEDQIDALKYDTQFRLDNIILEIEQERLRK